MAITPRAQAHYNALAETYRTNEAGRIVNPGKFEGEPLWVPYFWQYMLDGMQDRDDGTYAYFNMQDEERELFPALADVPAIRLRETDDGFVYGELCSAV